MNEAKHTMEVVRGRLDRERADELVRFWVAAGALSEPAARHRLADVVCVLRDRDGAVAGVNSVYSAAVELIGGRSFWIYRSFLAPAAADAAPQMVRSAFGALDAEFEPGAGRPIGLCLLISDRAELARRPEAVWPDPRLVYAGYLGDGRQVRIAYFAGARIDGGAGG